MADINKSDIKLLQSQRLDDTDQGGGQMTSHEVVDGEVNNLFPDISRLDRVYGRVSMRKAYLAVQTTARETYYGSHTILTEQAADPNVSVCFFSNKDWFDTRKEARDRIEAYLVKGPHANIKLWGDHYKGTSLLKCVTMDGWPVPEIGDVLVLSASQSGDAEQYVRVIDVSTELNEFVTGQGSGQEASFWRRVINITIGTQLAYDFKGTEVYYYWNQMNGDDIHTTVAADASRYYGVATLQEDANAGELQIRIDDIQTHLVPSAASETAITDAGVGTSVAPMLQTRDPQVSISRSIQFNIAPNAKLHIGEGILPGSFSWSGGLSLNDDGEGNIYNGSTIVGSIVYATGIITFGNSVSSSSGTGTATYIPACSPQQISHTGGIQIDTNNRGFVYVFNCNPLPMKGTLKVEYLAGGKWYSIWDIGTGQLKNPMDDSIGSGSVNFDTGSVSVTLGAMPDVDSQVLFFWAKPAEYYDFSGETLPLRYKFVTQTAGVARNTFSLSWVGDGNGPGPNGEYAIVDDGNGALCTGTFNVLFEGSHSYSSGDKIRPTTANGYIYTCTQDGTSDSSEPTWPTTPGQTVAIGTATFVCEEPVWGDWAPSASPVYTGKIRYATGEVDTTIDMVGQSVPVANEVFRVYYNYGSPYVDTFNAPPQNNNRVDITLTNTPIVPGTFKIEWHNDLEEYDLETRFVASIDPTYIFKDDGSGNFEGDVDDGTAGWFQGTVDYVNGDVSFAPHRTQTFAHAVYTWVTTEWHHPGVTQSYVFDHIEYLPAASIFPVDGTVVCSYCTVDGTNLDDYSGTLEPIYVIRKNSGLELVPGGVTITASGYHLLDGRDGKLYRHSDGVNGDKIHVGNINYVNKSVTIISDTIPLDHMEITGAVGTAALDPLMSMVFRAPGAPIRPGSASVRATTGAGTLLEATSDFNGNFNGTGVFGTVNFNTGLCVIGFGEWVPDDSNAQSQDWYNASANDGAGNVWKPYSVAAHTILMNCVVTSYLPLDPELLGLDPVRLPLDGKVPIFRDGYIIVVHNSVEENTPHPLSPNDPLTSDVVFNCGRSNVDLIEVYALPTAKQIEDGTQTCAELVPEVVNGTVQYEVDLTAGTVTFKTGFELPKDSESTLQQLVIMNRIEDMCLASDVQVTGHIAITSPLVHSYPSGTTKVSSVLPSADLQSRAYNEFEQETWSGEWLDYRVGAAPLASYNFVDYPIMVINRPSIKERWLILFKTPTTVQIVGENFGVLADNVDITTGNIEYPIGSGNWFVGVVNRNFQSDNFPYYFLMNIDGFGLGWNSGNNIRFNQDAANFPLWFVRTTLQAPPTEPIDHYTIQIRGDSS